MNSTLQFQLTRHPALYEKVLQLKGRATLEKRVFLNLIHSGDVVVEVGANRGHYTILFSHIVGKSGKVHAFEPVPPTFRMLTGYVEPRIRFGNIILNNLAVGDAIGDIELFMPGNDDGQASIAKHTEGSWKDAQDIVGYQCRISTLDNYTKNEFGTKLDFVKIDAEGAEFMVLKGSAETLKRYTPIVHLEVCHSWTQSFGYTPADVIDFLQSLGYRSFYKVTDKIEPIHNTQKDLSHQSLPVSTNILAVALTSHSAEIDRLVQRYGVL